MNKKTSESLDFLKNKYLAAELDAPQSLEESVIKSKLKSEPKQPAVQSSKRIPFKALLSTAACFVLIISIVFAAGPFQEKKIKPLDYTVPGEVQVFSSYNELYRYIKSAEKNSYNRASDSLGGSNNSSLTDTGEPLYGSAGISSDGTYIQEKDVNEADVIKKYGSYIVTCNDFDVLIYKTDNGNYELASKIDCSNSDFPHLEYYPEEMFISGDILAINITLRDGRFLGEENFSKDDPHYNYASCETMIKLYNISDPENPQFISQITQSGKYKTSRLVGNTEYLLSTHYTSDFCNDAKIPYTITESRKNIASTDIAYMENSITSNCTIINAIDITTGKIQDTKAVFGISDHIYCTAENIYFTNSEWNEDENFTQLIKASIKNNKIDFIAETKIKGSVLNQFSMSEKDGNLRVAVTVFNIMNTKNNLYIFDEKLNTISITTDFANGESIQSVCFIGNMAYIITYKKTDPLFVIDVSNPENPEIKGEVEITGFSSNLIPVNETTLLGIGHESFFDDNGYYNGSGLKFALFDVSDPEKPAVLDSTVLNDINSEAQYNHKAVTINPEKGYFAIPISYNGKTILEEKHYIITINTEENKINITNQFQCMPKEYEFYIRDLRCAFVDDYIYASVGGNLTQSFYTE